MFGQLRLVCEYEEHTGDLDDNRILAWTLYILPRLGLQREEARRQVRQALRAVAGVVETRRMEWRDCIHRFYHRLNEDYRPLHGLCRFFLEHCGPGIDIGEHNFLPFVVNMPNLFQSFVAKWLQANLPSNVRIDTQYRAELDYSGSLAFKIDIVLTDVTTSRVLAVLDTKYKRKLESEEADIEQIVAYAVRMQTQNAFLVYPSTTTRSVSLNVGDIHVRSVIFDIGTNLDEAGSLFLDRLGDTFDGGDNQKT